MKTTIAAAVLAASSSFSVAAVEYVGSAITKVSFITSYNRNGDVMLKLETPIESCKGYWLNVADTGFDSNMSMLIAAFQANSKVRIYGLPAEDWAGSSGNYCKVYSVEYHK